MDRRTTHGAGRRFAERLALVGLIAVPGALLAGCPTLNIDAGSEVRAKALRNFDRPYTRTPAMENAESSIIYGPDYGETAGGTAEIEALNKLPPTPGR